MKTVKELRKKAAARSPQRRSQILSTSEARANFAEALEMAQVDNAIIGFDRYGRPIAILAPVEAVLMLAGHGDEVSPRKREAIKESARLFAANMPGRVRDDPPLRRTRSPAKKKPAKKKKSMGKTV